MTRILLLRHAESADPNVFHGAESDIGLSDRGRRQAVAIAPFIAACNPIALISSAMRRARDTADPIARACGLNVLVEPDLHERRVGALKGMPFQSPDGIWPETLRRWMNGDTKYAPLGAESFDDIKDRVLPVWERITSEYCGKVIAIVAHGVVCKVLIMTLTDEYGPADWQRLGPIWNVAITELVHSLPRWELVRLNELPKEVVQA